MNRPRLVLGSVLFALSLLPYAAVPVVPFLRLSTARAASSIGAIVVFAEAMGLLAVFVLGTEGIVAIKSRFFQRQSKDPRCRS